MPPLSRRHHRAQLHWCLPHRVVRGSSLALPRDSHSRSPPSRSVRAVGGRECGAVAVALSIVSLSSDARPAIA
eukprot:12066012-Alexandrium_andersonii.AAC.1